MISVLVEKVARTLCWKNGMNPDLTLGGDGQNFLWHEYIDPAKAAIKDVIEEVGSVCTCVACAAVVRALGEEG